MINKLKIEHTKANEVIVRNVFYNIRSSLWIKKFNIVKMAMLPKLTSRYSGIPIKISGGFFCRN